MDSPLTPGERIAVAFDVPTAREAMELRAKLGDSLELVKLGSALFVREGMELVEDLKDSGVGVFLDLKFHDIPSVVAAAVEKAIAGGVDYLTVHAAGGARMIETAVDMVDATAAETRILAVTVLTSLDLEGWKAGVSPAERSIEAAVRRLAVMATEAGAHGLVGSAREARILREAGGPASIVVTPGIQVPGTPVPDQSRVATVDEAIAAGSDILVVGRGVCEADDPVAALESIRQALEEVES